MIKVVVIGLLIALFLWVLYERKRCRTAVRKESYQLFKFPYTDEAPNKDFKGDHPEYEYREFFREHFSDIGVAFNGSACPTASCSTAGANSLTTIIPINVSGAENKGFVMTLEMGRLPKQYHYRTTHHPNDASGAAVPYTGLDEAMVYNGFDINHEKSSIAANNPHARGFVGQCQYEEKDGKYERVYLNGTDSSGLNHFLHKSTGTDNMKEGRCIAEDKAKRIVFQRIGRENRWAYILTDTPNQTLLFAYGQLGNYTYRTIQTPATTSNGIAVTLFPDNHNSYFGDPIFGVTKNLYIAFEIEDPEEYERISRDADVQLAKPVRERNMDRVDGFIFIGTESNAHAEYGPYDYVAANEGGSVDYTGQYGVFLMYNNGDQHNMVRVISNQVAYATNSWWNNTDPRFGQAKFLVNMGIKGRFYVVDPDVLPSGFDRDVINAPSTGSLSAGTRSFYYQDSRGANERAVSVFDQTQVFLKEPIAGACSMTNVSQPNIYFPDNSNPTSKQYFELNAVKNDSDQSKLQLRGPEKLLSLYGSTMTSLEMHRNAIAFGGFAMNTISTDNLTNRGNKARLDNGSAYSVLNNTCTIASKSVVDYRVKIDIALKELFSSSCTDSQRADPNSNCGVNGVRAMDAILRIFLNKGNDFNKIVDKLVEWNFIDWFASQKGYPSQSVYLAKLSQIVNESVEIVRSTFGSISTSRSYSNYEFSYTIAVNFARSYEKNPTTYRILASFIDTSINTYWNQVLFDVYAYAHDRVRVKAIINSLNEYDIKRTWMYAVYPEDRKRSRIYFDGYAAGTGNRWASGAFKVNDPRSPGYSSTFNNLPEVANYLNGTGSCYYNFVGMNINLNDIYPLRSVVIPHKFTRGSLSDPDTKQMKMVNAFPRVYSVLKFYNSSGEVMFTLFWAHIPLYPGCGYPTMNFEVTDKFGKPDFMNNNYHDNIFIFYLLGKDSEWKQEIRDNGIEPICEEDFYIESVYHGRAQCLRSIDSSTKRLNPGNYVRFAEDGLVATIAPNNPRSTDVLGGDMGSFRIYVDQDGIFVYKRKITVSSEATDYTVYSDYITIPGMRACTGFSCWTPFRETNDSQSVFKSIKIETPVFTDSLTTAAPVVSGGQVQPVALQDTDDYRNIAQKRESVMSYGVFKHPCNPTRANTEVTKNINVLKAEGWRIVNVGASGWVNPKTTVLNSYKLNVKSELDRYTIHEDVDLYGATVSTMVSKWGLPTQEKNITRGEWIQINFDGGKSFNQYSIVVPKKFVSKNISSRSTNATNKLPCNRSISDWTVLGSNDDSDDKNWVMIDLEKGVDFTTDTGEIGTSNSWNYSTQVSNCVFTCKLKRSVTYKYVRLVVNALHFNNFENIFCLAYFGVSNGSTWWPAKGAYSPYSITTSIVPYGFDNNYNYSDSMKRPYKPMIVSQRYNQEPYNNARMDSGYYNNSSSTTSFSSISSADRFVHNLDHPFQYNSKLTTNPYDATYWRRGGTVSNWVIESGSTFVDSDIRRYSTYVDGVDEYSSGASYIDFTLGKFIFTWAEMHAFLNTGIYAKLSTLDSNGINDNRGLYNELFRLAAYNYSRVASDNSWRRTYNQSYDRRPEQYYEGTTITTYSMPCRVGDPDSFGNCDVFANSAPPISYNSLRADQEIADERFSWPQPYRGGSYLVSNAHRCVANQTCNGAGGTKDNVTPKYCFWIADQATYNKLVNNGFAVHQDFLINIKFDGDTNEYNDIPQMCLGKLYTNGTGTNLNENPISQFYPPPALYRTKGWQRINYSGAGALTLIDNGRVLKNAIISANNQVVYTFPDVATALEYERFESTGTGGLTATSRSSVKQEITLRDTISGCQGPALIGTNVTIGCPRGRIVQGDTKWGKWDPTSCRDKDTLNMIEPVYRNLPDRCIAEKTCTISEEEFGTSDTTQKRQWEVSYACDSSEITPEIVYQIPSGLSFADLHNNYHNLMKHVNNQTSSFDITKYPETMKWYVSTMEQEILESPEFKELVRKEKREHYKESKREHYWDGDMCKPVGKVFERAANGILDVLYNPIVSGINKVKLLRNTLGLTQESVTVNWSCPIPGMGEFIGGIVNAARAVGKFFTDAYNLVCQLGEQFISGVMNIGKWLYGRLQGVFNKDRFGRFFRATSGGLSAGFNMIGQSFMDNLAAIGEAASAFANVLLNFGASVGTFFMNPSSENFVAMASQLMALSLAGITFVLEIGLAILGFLVDVAAVVLGFIVDIGSWILNSIIGPLATAIADAFNAAIDWISSWF